MLIILAVIAILLVVLYSIARHFVSEVAKPGVDALANIVAAFVGVFFALAFEDSLKKEEENRAGINALRAASIGLVEELRPSRTALGSFRPVMLTFEPAQKQLLLKRFGEAIRDVSLPEQDIDKTLMTNEHIGQVLDENLLVYLVRRSEQLKLSEKAFNVSTDTLDQRYRELMKSFFLADDIFIRVCMAQAHLEGNISEDIYNTFKVGDPTRKDDIDKYIAKAKCIPLWNQQDVQEYLMDAAKN